MENERKNIGFFEKIKSFFRKIFKKQYVEALPEPEKNTKEEVLKSITINKEEGIELYNNIKNRKISVKELSREQLIMFITLAREELKILDKKINEEITQANMYKKDIEYYNQKINENA